MDRAENTSQARRPRPPLRARRRIAGTRREGAPARTARVALDSIFEPGSIEHQIVMVESLLEAATSRCEGLRSEVDLLERTADLGPPMLREVRRQQLARSRERLLTAERSELALNRLLVDVIRAAAYPEVGAEVVGGP